MSNSAEISVVVVSFTTCLFLLDSLLYSESRTVGVWAMKREGISEEIEVLVASMKRKIRSMDGIRFPLSNRWIVIYETSRRSASSSWERPAASLALRS